MGELERSGVEENWGVEGIEDKGDEKGEDFDDAAEPPGRGLNEKKIMPASFYKLPQNNGNMSKIYNFPADLFFERNLLISNNLNFRVL